MDRLDSNVSPTTTNSLCSDSPDTKPMENDCETSSNIVPSESNTLRKKRYDEYSDDDYDHEKGVSYNTVNTKVCIWCVSVLF